MMKTGKSRKMKTGRMLLAAMVVTLSAVTGTAFAQDIDQAQQSTANKGSIN